MEHRRKKNSKKRPVSVSDYNALFSEYSFITICFCIQDFFASRLKWCRPPLIKPRCWELRTQNLKPHLVRTQSLNGLSVKPGLDRYIAIHAKLTVIIHLLISTIPVHSPAFFPKLSRFFLFWLWPTHGPCVGPQNKIGHPAGCRFSCSVPAEYR